MYVGFMHNFKNPPELAKVIAMASKHHNIDIVYMRPMDVDVDNHVVRGKVLIDGKWVKKETEIPLFIDISPYCFKRKNSTVIYYLKANTFLSDNRKNVFTKDQLQEKLKQDDHFSNLVIPTENVGNVNDIVHYLNKYATIVLKPLNGIQGKGVFILTKEKNKYKIGHYTKEIQVDKRGLNEFYVEHIKPRRYIMQKYVHSRSLQGDPFDCRVHVEKSLDGKWTSAKNYIRVGIGQKVISNVNQGGGIADPQQFLTANFGEIGTDIVKKLEQLAVTLPYKIEELRGTHIMSLGIDVGIEKTGDFYLFEVNDGPATDKIKGEVAIHRSNYYRYVLENILNKELQPQEERLDDKISFYQKEVALYEKEISLLKKEISLLQKEKSLYEQVNK